MQLHDDSRRQYFMPLGIPAVVIADDPDLLATVRAAYSDWVRDSAPSEPGIEIRLETARKPSTGVGCAIRVEGSRLELDGPDFDGHADAVTGLAFCTVPPRLVGDCDALTAEILDTLLLFLLARSGRTPVHAAGVLVGDTALALLGPSGSGKSTLALAAAERGLKILSEDTLYVQREPRLQVWGMPRPVHVFPEDAPGGDYQVRERGGKRKAVVPLPPGSSHAGPVDKVLAILLVRGERLKLERLEPDSARVAMPPLDAGFDLLPEQSEAAMRALLGHGAWRLTLGDNAGDAIDLLLADLPLSSA